MPRNLFDQDLHDDDLNDNVAMLPRATCPMEHLFYSRKGKSCDKWHHYLELYDRHLARFRDRPVRLLEIGVQEGGSLELWREYFGAHAVIHGLDIDPACARHATLDLHVHIGDQSDVALLQTIVSEMGGIDLVIDDGSHLNEHQIITFAALFPLLSADGLYICEDTHTSYWTSHGGGFNDPRSFLSYAKRLVDDMHSWHIDEYVNDDLARKMKSVLFYDSMVVVERADREPPRRSIAPRACIKP